MYQHQHAPVPLEQLVNVPQPVVALLEVLLEKDPGWRFQSPDELLKALAKVNDAINSRRTITHQSLREIADQQLGASGKVVEFLTNLRNAFAVRRVRLILWVALVIGGGAILSWFSPWTQELRTASLSQLVTRNNRPRKEYRCSSVREFER